MVLGAGCAPSQPTASQGTPTLPLAYGNDDLYATPTGQTPSAADPKDKPVPIPEPTPNQKPTPTMNDQKLAFPGILPEAQINKIVHLKTTKGDITFEILPKQGPKAASNFVYLTGNKFYDGLTFHRVVPGFVIQGGDPQGTGSGGPGYQFEDDTVNLPYNAGIVTMANAGPNTNGSQFFIMIDDNPLPPNYSIFGRVTAGQDVVRKIGVGDKMISVTLEDKK